MFNVEKAKKAIAFGDELTKKMWEAFTPNPGMPPQAIPMSMSMLSVASYIQDLTEMLKEACEELNDAKAVEDLISNSGSDPDMEQ